MVESNSHVESNSQNGQDSQNGQISQTTSGNVGREVEVFTVHEYKVHSAMASEKKVQYWLKKPNGAFGGKARLDKHEVSLSSESAIQKATDDAVFQFNRAKERLERAQQHLDQMKKMVEENLLEDL